MTWTEIDSGGHFSSRYHAAVGLLANNLMLLVGGLASTPVADIWSSSNGGSSWLLVNNTGPWAPGTSSFYGGGYAVLPGTNIMMIASGYSANSVFVSMDGAGAVWTRQCVSGSTCPWSSSYSYLLYPSLTGLYDGQTWVLTGGAQNGGSLTNAVSISSNLGKSWSTYSGPFTTRYEHASASDLDNYVYIYGGSAGSDTWFTPNVYGGASLWQRLNIGSGSVQAAYVPSVTATATLTTHASGIRTPSATNQSLVED